MDFDLLCLFGIFLAYLLVCTLISIYFVVYFSHKNESNFTGLFTLQCFTIFGLVYNFYLLFLPIFSRILTQIELAHQKPN